MTHLQAVFLGILQGVTEFLPISSSGHLVLAEKFLSIKADLSFDVFLHLGTLLAVLLYFRSDWWRMLSFREEGLRRLLLFLVLGTIPGAIAGFFLEGVVEDHFRTPQRVAFMLAVMSIPLLLAELWGRKKEDLSQIKLSQALGVGLAQALAIIPGTSRSGITMAAGLLGGLNRESAARFSFLLSAPIIAGAGLYEGIKLVKETEGFATPYLSGFLGAFISGYLVIAWLLRFLRTHTFYPFIVYRLLLAGVVYVFL